MDYTDFISTQDATAFKRVKRIQMLLAPVARDIACWMVKGRMSNSGKEFVTTGQGTFRLCMKHNSDNSTERAANRARGVRTVVMGDDAEMAAFFQEHGLTNGVATFHALIAKQVGS